MSNLLFVNYGTILRAILEHLDAATREATAKPLTGQQQRVLEVLNGTAMKGEALAARLRASLPSLHARSLRPLLDAKRIQNHRRIGYYRPDALPSELRGTR